MNIGFIFAILAALFNASVGVLSEGAFISGVSAVQVAFYKCLVALLILSIALSCNSSQLKECFALRKHIFKIIPLALCGIFVLYYFETSAYQFTSIALTVFTLQGVSTITTFLASHFVLKVRHSQKDWLSLVLAMIGLAIFYLSSNDSFKINWGLLLATVAGIGYGLFLTLNKKVKLPHQGVPLLWWLLLLGTIFLAIPSTFNQFTLPSFNGLICIAALAILGTIGGFYCTIKALTLLDAAKVQLYELSEPIFAAALGLLFFDQILGFSDILGALFIFSAILLLNRPIKSAAVSEDLIH
ncbi:putative DMT superfamily transporter inner membrane protein [Legionella nautarum]|uniref:Putative DMT superfamily transporter inner membrane protein n=1 Tax=Legionella nautarum TaxID=45070 RepID=A0A0W0WTR0_9GAMM|nr:DMT family transporter [Legionella nautarum]KTD35698.1 putative DMT superfamily transporter inner membrane protein [Legionella nautarum]